MNAPIAICGATGNVGGRIVGKPELRYVRVSEDDMRHAMDGMGMSRSVIEAMIEMRRGFDSGRIRPTMEREAGHPADRTAA